MQEKLSKEKLKNSYDKWHSQRMTSTLGHSEKRHFSTMLAFLKPKTNLKILDVGCGQGGFLKVADERGLVTFGIDISQKAVEIAKKLSPASKTIIVGVGEELPWEDNEFDYVTCLGSLEHFLNPEKAIKEISRVLKTEGISLILLPNAYFLGHIYMVYKHGTLPDEANQTFSERFGTRDEWRNLLEKNGLKVLETHKYNGKFTSKKVNFVINGIYKIVRPIIPFNLSNDFIFICSKQ